MLPTFIFSKGSLLLNKAADGTLTLPVTDGTITLHIGAVREVIRVKCQDGKTVYAVDAPELGDCEATHELVRLRAAYQLLPKDIWIEAAKCEELLYWSSSNRYCGRCGQKLEWHTDISKLCPSCGKEIWPQLNTAIIVLIHRGSQVLLVHAHNFAGPFYGLVAGFVETGETLEEAVRREVREETNLEIDHITYFGSQPWPFPCGLMVGFNADYVSGELQLQKSELADGGWFDKEHLPQIPDKLSIARQLIDNWINTPQAKPL